MLQRRCVRRRNLLIAAATVMNRRYSDIERGFSINLDKPFVRCAAPLALNALFLVILSVVGESLT